MAATERITFADFQKRFKTEEPCREYLFQQRFPDGFVCPSYGAKEYYPIYRRKLCQCKKCRKQTSVTAGTVMRHTHLSLVLWFWAIYLCVNDKRGVARHRKRLSLHCPRPPRKKSPCIYGCRKSLISSAKPCKSL